MQNIKNLSPHDHTELNEEILDGGSLTIRYDDLEAEIHGKALCFALGKNLFIRSFKLLTPYCGPIGEIREKDPLLENQKHKNDLVRLSGERDKALESFVLFLMRKLREYKAAGIYNAFYLIGISDDMMELFLSDALPLGEIVLLSPDQPSDSLQLGCIELDKHKPNN